MADGSTLNDLMRSFRAVVLTVDERGYGKAMIVGCAESVAMMDGSTWRSEWVGRHWTLLPDHWIEVDNA